MTLGIVSPAAPPNFIPEREMQYEQGLNTLRQLGFDLVEAEHVRNNGGYVAASVQDRLADLHALYSDDKVEAIIAANGGWNSNQLLTGLDFDLIKTNPKPLVGFSDISGLLSAIYMQTGIHQIHGPMVAHDLWRDNTATNQSLVSALNKEDQTFGNLEFLQGSSMQGVLVGGNLASLQTMLGTPYEPDWQDKILFWEETDETVYRLDRILNHFKNAGVWQKVSGVLIGHLDKINEDFFTQKTDTWDMIKNHFAAYSFPVARTELFGHHLETNVSIPIGGRLESDGSNFSLIS